MKRAKARLDDNVRLGVRNPERGWEKEDSATSGTTADPHHRRSQQARWRRPCGDHGYRQEIESSED